MTRPSYYEYVEAVLPTLCWMLVIMPCSAAAQANSGIKGTVRGSGNESLAEVKVTAIRSIGDQPTTTTNQDGAYTLSLAQGMYVVTFEKQGFRKITQRNVPVNPPQFTVVDIHMDISLTGSLNGVVRDPKGAVLSGVHVTAINSETGWSRGATT